MRNVLCLYEPTYVINKLFQYLIKVLEPAWAAAKDPKKKKTAETTKAPTTVPSSTPSSTSAPVATRSKSSAEMKKKKTTLRITPSTPIRSVSSANETTPMPGSSSSSSYLATPASSTTTNWTPPKNPPNIHRISSNFSLPSPRRASRSEETSSAALPPIPKTNTPVRVRNEFYFEIIISLSNIKIIVLIHFSQMIRQCRNQSWTKTPLMLIVLSMNVGKG